MKYYRSGDIERLTGLSKQTLHAQCKDGTIVPAVSSRGTGNNRLFARSQVFAISFARWLRIKKGWGLRAAGNVMATLLALSDERLKADIGAGKTCLLLINGQALPMLCDPAIANESNPYVADVVAQARAAGIPVRVEQIDIGTAWADFLSKLQRYDKAQEVPA